MTLWEVTIAEALQSLGYATALFGKYDVGGFNWEGRREPTRQGFDEWWGIPGTSDTAQYTSFEGFDPARTEIPYIWEGKAGEPSRRVKPYDLETRRTIDREAAERGIAFMEKNVKKGKPFFFYFPMTQIHFPALPHPDFAGKTGAGDIGDAMADVDHNVGLVLEAIKRLGIERQHAGYLVRRQRRRDEAPLAGSRGPLARILQLRHGRGDSDSVRDSMARTDSGRARCPTMWFTRSTSSPRSPRRSGRPRSCRMTGSSTA